MKKLITKDGMIILGVNEIESLIGKIAHDTYFNLHKIHRDFGISLDEANKNIFKILNDEKILYDSNFLRIDIVE